MRVLIVTFFIVLSDQITKLYVKGIKIPFLGIDVPGIPYQSSINVYKNIFKITFIENPGMAFGLQIGGKLFLSLFTVFATVLLIIFLYKNRNESLLLRLSLAFILGGAIGNLIDRVFYGKIYDYAPLFYGRVVDFLHIDFPAFTLFGKNIYSWPIFNIADVFVTLGFLMILLGYRKIFHTDHEVKSEIQSEGMLIAGENNAELNNYNTETGNNAGFTGITGNTEVKINEETGSNDNLNAGSGLSESENTLNTVDSNSLADNNNSETTLNNLLSEDKSDEPEETDAADKKTG